ncbi:MAG: CYTH and CHAD domain-containing protein [Actinomycetia bacterium]|nr:CYTH and CHAD domain-containing protein [Actinomycetes bacterium]
MAKSGDDRTDPERHLEIEAKFDVGAHTVSPCFEGLSTVTRFERTPTQHLEALYYDTVGLDLAVNRMTLRRRTGGPDAGWHLKLPAGKARTEIRLPLGPDGAPVPDELLDTVLAIVRDRPLFPVARLSTTRDITKLYGRDDIALAEFCDDRVDARRIDPAEGRTAAEMQWREWELELLDTGAGDGDGGSDDAGAMDRLAARLLDTGAVPAGHGSKLAKILGEAVPRRAAPPTDPVHRAVVAQVANLLKIDRAVRADADDAVHQMRVTIRQIRSLLQASEQAFGLTDDATILSELRELAAVLGLARDAEVLAERYRAALDGLAPELVRGPVRERLVGGARRRYQSGLNRSLRAMRSVRYFRLLDALDAVVVNPPAPVDDEHPPATVATGYTRVRRRARSAGAATGHDRDDALHRVRKAAKRLRYLAAATGDSKVAARAKRIQTLLGDHQDSVVSRGHLLQEATAARTAGEDTFTYGVLFAREAELARRCEEQLDDALKALRRSVREAS